jgi:hypothetical protein
MEANSNGMKPPVMANIRAEWDWVKEGVEEILNLSRHLTWRPEDIYASCLSGESALWIRDHDWFVVSTIEVDQFNGARTFLIWLSWTRDRGNGVASEMWPFFEMVARQSGCDMIEVRTEHKRVGEYIETDLGWDCQQMVFSKDLD